MQKIRIDFDNPGLPQHISAVENDSQSRFFQATLYENGKAYTAPEGAAYSIMYRGFGPQNQGWYDTINDGAGKRSACAVSGNVVTCEIARQALQVPGHVSIVLCVTTGKGYMLKSWPIECDCKNDRYDSTVEIQSFFYITQVSNADWTQAIQAVEELKNTIDPTLSLSGKAADAKTTGDAVSELKEDIDDIVRGNQPFAIVKDEYVNTDGEIIKTNTKWDRTDYIEINDNLVIISKSSSKFNCFFDSTKKFVSDFPLSDGKNRIFVPGNAKYIICSNTSDAIKELIVKSDNSVRITDLENDTEIALKSRKNLIGTIPNKFYPIDYKANENITFSTKGLVPVTKNHVFYFYDENKEYVTDLALFPPLAKRTVSFDKDAKYISLKTEQEYPIQVEYGETATEYEDYLLKSSDLMARITDSGNDTSIITLNKQLEPFVIQSTATKASGIGSSLKPLTFIHFSDWHNVPVLWERLCDYMEEYKDYIQFALHTGDYCGNWQGNYTDAYLLKNTTNPILNCVGNHDTYTQEMKKNTQESAYKLLFNHIDNWGVTFGSGNNTMYYYKDFPDSEIRLIVLDCYYDIDNQKTWLEEKLNEAKDLNYAVITAMHEVSKSIVDKIQCTFQTLDNYESAGGNVSAGTFDTIIKTFKDNGGVHIVNLCGHEHDDMFGYTSNGVLNLVVECATIWNGWTGGKRIKGTKTYDCFNVFSVEKDTGIFKVVRIGDNSDHYLREKNVLSYDYINKKVLYNA